MEVFHINKEARRLKRINADIEKKEKKFLKESQEQYTYEKVMSYQNIVASYKKCLPGVTWKGSIQKIMLNPITRLWSIYESLSKYQLPKNKYWYEMEIRERGKARIITPIYIDDRIVQKTICDYLLTPIFMPRLIYDNGASMPNKGSSFTRKRLDEFLAKALREYGEDFYILKFDFKDYFNSVSHKIIRDILTRYIIDERLVNLIMDIVKAPISSKIKKKYKNNPQEKDKLLKELEEDKLCGMCLGSQISQLLALIIPNQIDHYIKDACGYKYYCRYNDDGVIIAKSKDELKVLLENIKQIADNLGITINPKKTAIIKSSRGFIFIQRKYNVINGTIIKRLCKNSIIRMRRKLKRFKNLYNKNKITTNDVYNSLQSWVSCNSDTKSYLSINKIVNLAYYLFGEEILMKGGRINEFL